MSDPQFSTAPQKPEDATQLFSMDMDMTGCYGSQGMQLSETMQRWEDQSTRVFSDSLYTAPGHPQMNSTQMNATVNFQYGAEEGDGDMELTGCQNFTINQGGREELRTRSSFLELLSDAEPKKDGESDSVFSFSSQEPKIDTSKFLSKLGVNKQEIPAFLASDSPIQFNRRASSATETGNKVDPQSLLHRLSLGNNMQTKKDPLAFLNSEDQSTMKNSDSTATVSSPRDNKVDTRSFLSKLGVDKQKIAIPAFLMSDSPSSFDKIQRPSENMQSLNETIAKKEPEPELHLLKLPSPTARKEPSSSVSSSSSANEDEAANRTRLFSENDMEFTACLGEIATGSQNIATMNSGAPAMDTQKDHQDKTQLFSGETCDGDMEFTGVINSQVTKAESIHETVNPTSKQVTQNESFTKKDLFRLIMDRKSSVPNAQSNKTEVFSSSSAEMEFTACLQSNQSPEDKTRVFSSEEGGMDLTGCLGEKNTNDVVDKASILSANNRELEITNCVESKKNSYDAVDRTRVFSPQDGDMEITTCMDVKKDMLSASSHEDTRKLHEHEQGNSTKVFSDTTGDMEITTCMGVRKDVVNSTLNVSVPLVKEQGDRTKVFSTVDGDMEMTACQSGAMNKTLNSAAQDVTKQDKNPELMEKTKVFASDDMEMTACLDDVVSAVNKTLLATTSGEATKHLEEKTAELTEKTRVFSSNDGDMEMTSCLGEIVGTVEEISSTTLGQVHVTSKRSYSTTEEKPSESPESPEIETTKVLSANEGDMELTACLQETTANSNKTKVFAANEGNMEITCVTDKTESDFSTSESDEMSRKNNEVGEKTQVFSTDDGDMEMTSCLGERKTSDESRLSSNHFGISGLEERKENMDKTKLFTNRDMEMTCVEEKTVTSASKPFSPVGEEIAIASPEEKGDIGKNNITSNNDNVRTTEESMEEMGNIPSKDSTVTFEQGKEDGHSKLRVMSTSENIVPATEPASDHMDRTTSGMSKLEELTNRVRALSRTSVDNPIDTGSKIEAESIHKDSTDDLKEPMEEASMKEECKVEIGLKRTASFPNEQGKTFQQINPSFVIFFTLK